MIELEPGAVFEKQYRVIERLGKGGMAYIYLVESLELQSLKFAVKLIKLPEGDPLLREDFLQRFRREAELLHKLGRRNNPHIIHLHGYRETSELGIPYLLLEYLDGIDLGKLLSERGSLPLPVMLVIARQVASALETLHAEKIVHRDLSPQNIFICEERSEDGDSSVHVKLLDFGVAKSHAPGDPLLTNVSMFVGKPAYASPEQFLMLPDLDHRSDQFCLAAIVYEMLCGERAFMRADDDIKDARLVRTIRDRVLTADPLESKSALALPEAVRQVLARALSKHRDQRFPATREFLRALSAAALPPERGELTTGVSSDSVPPPPSQIGVWVTISTVGLLCLMLAVSIWNPVRMWQPATPPDLASELADLDASEGGVMTADFAVAEDLSKRPDDLAVESRPDLLVVHPPPPGPRLKPFRFTPAAIGQDAKDALINCLHAPAMRGWLNANPRLVIRLTRMDRGKFLATGFAARPQDAQYYNDRYVECLTRSLRPGAPLPAAVTISK